MELKNIALSLLAVTSCIEAVSVTQVLSLDIDSPAVTTFVPKGVFDANYPVILATTFSPTAATDNVLMLNEIVIAGNTSSSNIVSIDLDAVWPNQADPYENIIPGSAPAVIGAGGFFVNVPGGPSKSTGSVDLYFQQENASTAFSKLQVSQDKTGYFYHKAGVLDANGNGLNDLMGARCYVPNFGASKAELVVMLQPSDGSEEWETKVVFQNGPDVFFVLVDLDNDGNTQVISTEYFVNQRLALYSCGNDNWSNCENGNGVSEITIDESEGAMFDVAFVDLNGDGIKDLLATSQGNKGSGNVLAYEQPPNGWDSAGAVWEKHILADGYAPIKKYVPGQGSPGTAVSFQNPTGGIKPWIVVSADDGGWVDLLVPFKDSDVLDWNYNKTRIVQSDGTVGTPAVGDLNGDGVPEIVVPLYNENRIAIYTLNDF